MKKTAFSLILTLCLINTGTAQQTINEGHIKAIHDFVDGYNTQDFGKMRGTMSAVFKLAFSEKKVKELYGLQHQLLGNAVIDSITTKSADSYMIALKYERDITEVQTMGLAFSGQHKIIGMSNPSFKLQFAKTGNTPGLTEAEAFRKIDSLVSLKQQVADFNGCVLVLKNKQEFYKKCAGYANLVNKTALNDNTLFDLASCSKQFTAMAIMILQEQGKLQFEDMVEKYFPDFPYKNISIENLLTHTAGLPDYMELFEKHWDKSKIAGNSDVLELLQKHKPKISFKPGKEFEYSNTGYVMLAAIIEKVSGLTYASFLSDNIFQPLGMKNSLVYNTKYSKNEIKDNYAYGHTYLPDSNKHVLVSKVPALDYYRYLDGITGDGAVNTTILDMTIWDNSLRENKLVTTETFIKALKPYKTTGDGLSNYGYGWELQNDTNYERLIYHSGNWGGNITFVLHFLDKDISVIILSNNEYLNTPKFVAKIAAIVNKQ